MDVSLPPLAPRAVPDLRPSADIAASARATLPAPALPPGSGGVPPASALQGALVARGLLDPRAVTPLGGVNGSGQSAHATSPDRPPARFLKPWGVPMLPAEEREPRSDPGAPAAAAEPETPEATGASSARIADGDGAPPAMPSTLPGRNGVVSVDHVPPSIRALQPAKADPPSALGPEGAAITQPLGGKPAPEPSSSPVRAASTD